jgi:lipid-A-disaccharide synthase
MLLVLPGSRQSEVARLSASFGETLDLVAKRHPGLCAVVPAAGPVVDAVRAATDRWSVPVHVLDPTEGQAEAAIARKRAAFRAADVALAASGTVSLELAAARTPMVIAYRMNPLTFRIIKRLALVDTVTLVNLVSDTRAVPEFLGPSCVPGDIADSLLSVLQAPDAQNAAMEQTMIRLGEGGEAPGLRAARVILKRL